MTAPDHAVRAHAKLGASSSERWLACTAAPTLEEGYADSGSSFAAEGTLAHELAERTLVSGRNARDMSGNYTVEMRDFVQAYVDYVRGVKGDLLVEQRLDMTDWVPEGFGTADAVVIQQDSGTIYVIDLKYGVGVPVSADDNSQLKLYGLGALAAFDTIYEILNVVLVIVQPRLDSISEWAIGAADLRAWGDSIRATAQEAYTGPGVATPGDHCRWCKAKHDCRARAEQNLAIARDEMGAWCPPSPTLSDAELAALYPKLDGLVRWANDVQAHCLSRAETGARLPGLKLVEGRSVRCWADEAKVEAALTGAGLSDDDIHTRKLITITAAEKLLGKKEFSELLGDHIVKPPGKPTLTTEDDKRPAISNHEAAIAEMANHD